MDVIDFLTVFGYTITVFAIGYTIGKDIYRKK